MENIREEVVDIRSCIAYLMVKWKILLLALILGVLAGGGFGYMKQKTAAAAPAQVSYEEKLGLVKKFLYIRQRAEKIRTLTQDPEISALSREILEVL